MKEVFKYATELLRPEAREFLKILRAIPETTQDHYAEVWQACVEFKDYRFIFLNALVEEGYNPLTAEKIKELI